MNVEQKIEQVFNRLPTAKRIVYDAETSGLSWQRNHCVGHVFTFGPAPQDTYYLPVRHAGGGNIVGVDVPVDKEGWTGDIHPLEAELMKQLDRPDLLVEGHNLSFDLKFKTRLGSKLKAKYQDSQINAPLINEFQSSVSLDFCAKIAGVQQKKTTIYDYLASLFPEVRANPKQAMGHFWRLAGDDPQAVEYAEGDGTSTWQVIDWQQQELDKQELRRVWDIECRLIPILAKMTTRGVRIDEERLHEIKKIVANMRDTAMQALPEGFNSKAPTQVKALMEKHGYTDWPLTPKGAPSFTEAFLKTNDIGQLIIKARQYNHLLSSFIEPMIETHLWNGRAHPDYNQLRGDEFGTITGRLSSSNPNLQQIPKRNKELSLLYRSIFVPDEGKIWGSVDYSQCLVAGTRVTVPGGTKNIEDMKPGDLVYSYDNSRNLVLRRVTWAGQTGVRPVCLVRWMTNGRTSGELRVTPDHKIRLLDGTYKTVSAIAEANALEGKRRFPYFVRVLAVRRGTITIKGETRNYLWTTGKTRFKESRFVFEQVNGWAPEEVHHTDGDTRNDNPSNLEGLTVVEHKSRHMAYGMGKLTRAQRQERSRAANEGKKLKVINNHYITHIIPMEEAVPVYDITVEDTHNFIANEICVHNCEPRLLAYYSGCKVLTEGYNAKPSVDAHTAVAVSMYKSKGWDDWDKNEKKAKRENAKRVNQTLVTGGGKKVIVEKYGVDPKEVDQIWEDYFGAMPEIKVLQNKASNRMRQQGYVYSLLGRRARLPDPNRAYVATNRLLQLGNADILKQKAVEINEYIESEKVDVDMLNNCHDAFDFQFPECERKHYEEIKAIMVRFGPDDAIPLTIPMEIDAGEGRSWSEATWGAGDD